MIKEYENNIDVALKTLKELAFCNDLFERSYGDERKLLAETIFALKARLKIINSSIPMIIRQISVAAKLPSTKEKESPLEVIEIKKENNQFVRITLDKKYKRQFLEELRISENNLERLNKKRNVILTQEKSFKKRRIYLTISNKIFLSLSRNYIKKGYFSSLSKEIKKSNMDVLTEGYVSMIFFTTLLAVILGIIGVAGIYMFNTAAGKGTNLLVLALEFLGIPSFLGILSFFVMYFYPRTEKRDIENKINQELPFAVVYMSAIAGSGIEPTAIFKIIAFSQDYPYLKREIRKVLNQINIYGYDLITALTNVAKSSPSKKLAELFSGLTTTITSGGSLAEFFQKRAESLVLEYRLEREKFSKVAETSMDLYITIVIAAPMILLLLFILMSVSEFAITLSPSYITFLIIGLIAVVNIVFLSLLHMKQPTY